jgi:hypothetical protein
MGANWAPLEKRLGYSLCVGFMFMGRINGVNRYKHGITRTYLNLDDAGTCYSVGERGACTLANWDEELGKLQAALSTLGASLTTAYDDAFFERKRKSLQERGIALTINIEPQESNIH